MTTFSGSCHCGAIAVAYETAATADAVKVRACQCSFCRRHGARTVADPAGSVSIAARRPQDLQRYRFGLRTADFLLCRNCGVYVAAVYSENGLSRATVNANCLRDGPPLTAAAAPVDYEGEAETDRRARRAARWTPVKAFTIEESA